MRSRCVMVVYGTRPEAIKMAPLVARLRDSSELEPFVVVTGQHRQMLDQVNTLFGITPDVDLDIIQPSQSLTDVTTRALAGVNEVVRAEQPAAVVVQGDTTTAFAGALAAFYEQVPVAHLEAGLRTDDRYSPFPEEINRRLVTQLATLHLAPTATSRDNLLASGVDPAAVAVTGNTVIDALLTVADQQHPYTDPRVVRAMDSGRRIVLVTTHRRESWGERMRGMAAALAELATARDDIELVVPMHRNPTVREALRGELAARDNVVLTDPLAYAEFGRVMREASVIVTDSGGVQEEAPSLGKPVLVLRDNTERPEAVAAGTVRLIGTDPDLLKSQLTELLDDPRAYARMANAANPYGDGHAAPRCVAALRELLGLGERLSDFEPAR